MLLRLLFGAIISGMLIVLGYYFMGDWLLDTTVSEKELGVLKINTNDPEYQIYNQSKLPTVHSLSDDCENLAKNLLATIEKNNFCQTDTDCKSLPFYGYPIGANNTVNKNEYKNSIKVIDIFVKQKNKWQCEYPMYELLSLSNYSVVCIQQKCRYEKIRPTLSKTKIPK